MTQKFWLYLTLASCLFVGSFADEYDDVAALIQQLGTTVQSATATSTNQINIISAQLATFGQEAVASGQRKVMDDTELIRKQLFDLRLLAEALDAIHCLYYKEKGLDMMSGQIQMEIWSCVEHVSEEATNTIAETLDYLNFAQNRVDELAAKLEQCGPDGEDPACLIQLRGEVQLALDSLPTEILDQTILLLFYSRDWEQAMTNCAEHRQGLIFVEGDRLVLDVETCLIAVEAENVGNTGLLRKA